VLRTSRNLNLPQDRNTAPTPPETEHKHAAGAQVLAVGGDVLTRCCARACQARTGTVLQDLDAHARWRGARRRLRAAVRHTPVALVTTPAHLFSLASQPARRYAPVSSPDASGRIGTRSRFILFRRLCGPVF
jgi:hypothetical protein